MDLDRLVAWCSVFFQNQWDLVSKALPMPESFTAPAIEVNDDSARVVGTLEVDLHYSNKASDSELQVGPSDLYSAYVEYRIGTDRTGEFPAVQLSSFQIRAAGRPAIRFEYDREKTSSPAAHIHVHGVGGLLSPGLMRNRNGRGSKGDWQALHLPVGGHRFRPSLEDFLYFSISECGFRGRDGWQPALLAQRETWLDLQCKAAVRDAPEIAAEVLRNQGYTVTAPDVTPANNRHDGW